MDWQTTSGFDNNKSRNEVIKKAIIPSLIISILIITSLVLYYQLRDNIKGITFSGLDYGYKVKYLHINDDVGKIAYIDEGSGKNTIIFIHGVGVYLKYFKKQIDFFKTKYRVIALDMPGYGKSDFNNKLRYGLNLHTKAIESFIKKLSIKKPIVAGHSYGGMVSVNLVANSSVAAKKLILISPAGLLKQNKTDIKYLKSLANVDENRIIIPQEAKRAFNRTVFNSTDYVCAMRKEFMSLVKAGEYKKFNKTRTRVFKDIVTKLGTFHENINYLRLPVLIIAGEDDRIVPLFKLSAYRSRGSFPRAINFFPTLEEININIKVKLIKRCGHIPLIEQPAEVNRIINDFLSN